MIRPLSRTPRIRRSLYRPYGVSVQPHSRPLFQYDTSQRRGYVNIPTVFVPPIIFGGLFIALWTWKCLMMVLFQNKIIYMPGLPPNARRERIEDHINRCGGVKWREERIKSTDGTRISLCVAQVGGDPDRDPPTKTCYILFFTGNSSSLPPQLPLLSYVLRALQRSSACSNVQYVMVCCSYRGYWTSKGRPSEKGIAKDAAASLEWIRDHFRGQCAESREDLSIIVWGHSIGSGVATNLVAGQPPNASAPKALILETPFLNIRAMLETLYPQKWLPYRYLWPFLWNNLDSWKALGLIRERLDKRVPYVLILVAEKDEIVPRSHGKMLEMRCKELGINARQKIVRNALHNEVIARQEGIAAIVDTIRRSIRDGPDCELEPTRTKVQ